MHRSPCCAPPRARNPEHRSEIKNMNREKYLALSLMLVLASASCRARDLVIHAGTLLDGVSDLPRHQVSIVIQNDRIKSVDSGFITPPGAEILDLSDATVMPGFIDCHVHISAL